MDNRPIGMFDSGVGGLTVFKEVKKELPYEKIIYIGDTKSFPYGSKTKEAIIDLSKKCIDFLISKNVKAIIIACGTATSQALETVQKIYNIPIIGIIEPTVEYIKEKKYKKIGVIATRGTIKSGSWEKQLKSKIKDIEVENKACPLLAPMAEEGWIENEIANLTIKEYLKGFVNIDALILGCTHYPLFEKIIEKVLPKTKIINTGTIIAKYLKQNQDLKNMLNEDYKFKKEVIEIQNQDEFYLTDDECNFIDVADKILNKKIKIKEA